MSSVFSQQPITPTKPLVSDFSSLTVIAISLVFSQPIIMAIRITPSVAGSPSLTVALLSVFSPFKF